MPDRPDLSDAEEHPGRRRTRWRAGRRVRQVALAFAIAALLLPGLLYVGPVQRAAFDRAASWVEQHYGLAIRASRVEVDPASLRVTLDDLSVAAIGTPGRPFFTASSVVVDAARGILSGRPVFDRVTVRDASLDVRALPAARGDSAPFRGLGPLTLGDVSIDRFSLVAGEPGSVEVTASGLSLRARGDAPGRLQIHASSPGTLVIVTPAARLPFDTLSGTLTLDGARLTLGNVNATSSAGRVDVTGALLLGTPEPFHLQYTASVDLGRASAWLVSPPDLSGRATISGEVTGPFSSPVATVRMVAESFAWSGLTDARLDMQGVLSAAAARIDAFDVRAPLASAQGHGRLAWSDADPPSTLSMSWQAPRVRPLGPLVGLPPDVLPRVTAEGTADLHWPGFVPGLAGLSGAIAGTATSGLGPDVDRARIRLTGGRREWRIAWEQLLPGETLASLDATVVVDPEIPGRSPLSGALEIRSGNVPAALRRLASAGLPLPAFLLTSLEAGRVEASGALAGTLGAPRWQAALAAEGVGLAGLGGIGGDGVIVLTPAQLDFPALALRAPNSRGRLSGALRFDDRPSQGEFDGVVDAAWAGASFVPEDWPLAGAVRMTGRWPAASVGTAVEAEVEAASLQVAGRLLGPVSGRVGIDDAEVVRADLEIPDLATRVAGTYPLSGEGLPSVRVALLRADLARLLAIAGIPGEVIEGVRVKATGSVQATGPLDDVGALRVAWSLEELSGDVRGLHVGFAAPGSGHWSQGAFEGAIPGLSLGGIRLSLENGEAHPTSSSSTLTVTAPLADLARLLPAGSVPEDIQADGVLRAAVEIPRAAPTAIVAHASADVASIARAGMPVAQNVRLEARLADGRLEVGRLGATVLGAAVSGTAMMPASWIAPWLAPADSNVPGGPPSPRARLLARVDASLAPVLTALGRSVPELGGSARLVVDLDADAPRLDRVNGTIVADALRLSTARAEFAQVSPSRLRVNEGRIAVESLVLQGPALRLEASGGVAWTGDQALDLHVRGTASMSLIDALVAPRVTGAADIDLHAGGTVSEPWLTGDVTLRGLNVTSPAARWVLADGSGRLALRPGVVEAIALAGQLNGGTVTASGVFPLRASAAGGGVRVEARDVFFEYPPGVRSRADGTLTVEGPPDTMRIGGTISLLTERYREPVRRMAQMAAALAQPSRAASPLPEWLSGAALDVKLVPVAPLRLDNSIGDVELEPDVRVVGTVGAPALDGPVIVTDGSRVRLQSRTYELFESRIEFSAAEGMVPQLALRGVTRVGEYDVTLRLTGPADAVEASLSSDPPLNERDLQALLLTGQAGESSVRTAGAERFAVTALSSDLLGIAGQAVGLDSILIGNESFELVSSDVNPATRLTASKSFLGRYEVIFSDNLDNNTYTWILVFRPRRGIELRASSRDNTELALEFRQRLAFGPGSERRQAQQRRASAAAARREIVDAVDVIGESPEVAARLAGMLRLRRGSTFEYRDWMLDVERIRRYYLDEGFLVAQVVPTRRVLGTGSAVTPRVALEYRVTRGPATQVVVEGVTADRELLARLRAAWFETAFDEFAAEDITRAARAVLVDRGHVTPNVETIMDSPAPDVQIATVRIQPGPRVTRRAIEFAGMTAMSRAGLDAIAALPGVAAEAWRDPASLCALVADEYAARGYRRASVTSQPIRVADNAAVLPIVIDEGVQTTVGRIAFEGVAPSREEGARAAAGLTSGAVLPPGAERVARLKVERFYRDLGYRNAAVTTRVGSPDDDGRMDVTFVVGEGRQYVVESVRVEGVRSTHRSLVDGAILLRPGAPASQDDLTATQRRLYQIGTFSAADVRLEPVEDPRLDTPPEVVPVDARVSVAEPQRFQLLYGVEYSNQYGPQYDRFVNAVGVAADVRDRNVFGRGYALSVGGRMEDNLQSVRSLFAVPRLGSTGIRTNVYASWKSEIDEFESGMSLELETRNVSVEQRWRQRGWLDLTWGAVVDDRLITLREEPGGWPISSGGMLVTLTGTVAVDRRDRALDAERGWFHSSSFQQGVRSLGSDLRYTRYLGRTFAFVPLGPLVSASGLRIGSIWGTEGTTPFSVLDLYFKAGGSQTVRGYKQDELSAARLGSTTFGGTKVLILNQELRFRASNWLQGVVFVDAGNTFGAGGFVLRDLAVGLGVGVRINTPVAPLRIDLGFPVPRRPGDPLFRWHFSIGQIF